MFAGGRVLDRVRRREWWARDREATRSASRETSSRSCLTLELSTLAVDMAATDWVETSMVLSAISARFSRVVEGSAEANTILTFGGNRWRKSSRRNEFASVLVPSFSPSNYCIFRNNWFGLRSPNSSPLINCCSLRCSDAAVRLMSCAFKVS